MPWEESEARVAQVFCRKGRAGVALPDLDLFGEQVQRTPLASHAGCPLVLLRSMISLLYLKHAFNESDEGVVACWADTPRWQSRTQLEQATILMQDSVTKPATAFVGGVDAENPDVRIVHRGKARRTSGQETKLPRRRQATEPVIGHLKADDRMGRCHPKRSPGVK